MTGTEQRIAGLERQVGKLAEELRTLREEALRVHTFDELRIAALIADQPAPAPAGRRPRHLQVVGSHR